METWKCIYATGLKVRSVPSTAYGQVQSLSSGDMVEGVLDAATQWINISKIIRVNGNTFTPTTSPWWCSGLSLYMEKVVVTPAPVVESIYISHTFTDTLIVEKPDGSTQTYSATWTMPDVEYKPNP